MKLSITILLFILCGVVNGQQNEHNCPKGYSWMPTIGTTSLMIEASECLPDSTVKKLWLQFWKNMCGESGMFSMGDNYSHSISPKWVNDSIGCVTKETFEKKIKGEWVGISKCLYYWDNKSSTGCSTYKDGKSEEIPCCGHIHKTKPQ